LDRSTQLTRSFAPVTPVPAGVRGMCPGAYAPMASGDGWLIRLRTCARALASETLRELARLAHEHGSGIIELTRRANLQLRGLRLERMPELRSELIALGLVDASPEREARPGLVVDPLAALDSHSAFSELAGLLDAALAELAADGGKLPPKLGVVLDGGSGSVSNVDADIRIVAVEAATRVYVSTPGGEQLVVECERVAAPAVLRNLLRELAAVGGVRMSDLVAMHGLAGLQAAVGASAVPAVGSSAAPPRAALGSHDGWFGVAVPFGAASHAQWLAIADLAERFGDSGLRFSPAREVLITGVRSERADELAETARALGLIVEANDPRRRILACSGAPACSSAYGETRALASTLGLQALQLLAAGSTLHVSGCEKGCASRAVTELNVVLAPDGCARLALNADTAATSRAAPEPLAVVSKRIAELCRRST
jgi:precorrin-3B synthase